MKSINKNKLFIRILTLVSFLLMIFVFLPLLEFITMFNGMGFDHPTLFMNIVSTSFLLLKTASASLNKRIGGICDFSTIFL